MEKLSALTPIHFTARITEKEYIKVIFQLSFRRRIMRFTLIIILIQLIFISFNALSGSGKFTGSIAIIVGMVAGYFILLPALIYYRAKRNFHNAQHKISEIHYTFNEASYTTKNDLIDSTIAWDAIFKIQETKRWFLIYQNEASANFLSKEQMSPEQLREIKALFQRLPIMRKKLL